MVGITFWLLEDVQVGSFSLKKALMSGRVIKQKFLVQPFGKFIPSTKSYVLYSKVVSNHVSSRT